MPIRMRIPKKPLKTGVKTNRNTIDIRRKRNLSLKITCLNLEWGFSAIIPPSFESYAIQFVK
jgi:hypothetical protein